jgi:hypothetical protein
MMGTSLVPSAQEASALLSIMAAQERDVPKPPFDAMGSAIGKHHTSPDLNLSDLSAIATQRASACRARHPTGGTQ